MLTLLSSVQVWRTAVRQRLPQVSRARAQFPHTACLLTPRPVSFSANYKRSFESAFGAKKGKALMHASAGSLIGIGEIVLLPLDVLKIKRQTNPEAFRGRGILRIVADEGFALYRGWGWTAARNAPGSFAVSSAQCSRPSFLPVLMRPTACQLFGGSAFAKEYLLGLKDYSQATWSQNAVASIVGSISSLVVSQPLDVIKTRVQNQKWVRQTRANLLRYPGQPLTCHLGSPCSFESKVGGVTLIKDLIKNEGVGAFFKGLTPKVSLRPYSDVVTARPRRLSSTTNTIALRSLSLDLNSSSP